MAELKEKPESKSKTLTRGESMPLSDIFFMTLRHWPWILVSIAVCMGIAYLYLLRTPRVYTEAADIQIKDESTGQSSTYNELGDLGLFKTNTNIFNEMSALKSKDLMEEVVRRLDLDINYYTEGRFHNVSAYGSTLPVTVSAREIPDETSASFDLTVSPEGEVTISNMTREGKDFSKTYTGMLNQTFSTPLGRITVRPTKYYRKGNEVQLAITKSPVSSMRDSYCGRLGVEHNDDFGTVLHLTMADTSPERADDVLRTLILVYNENWIREKNRIAVSTSSFINDRLGVIEGELGNVDSDISSYKSANLVPDVGQAATMYMGQSQVTQEKILDIENQLKMTRHIRSYLSSDDNRDQLLPSSTGLESASVQLLIKEYNTTLIERNALVNKSSDRNPLVAQADEQLRAQRRAIIRTVDNEIESLSTQLASLTGREASITSRIASNPQQAKNLLSVERQQKVKESLYLYLLQKREENELSQAFTAYNTKVLNRPGSSSVPPSPNSGKILTIAFLIGLMLPFGVTFVDETTNTKVRGRKDVEDLATPFLGEIPQEGASNSRMRKLFNKITGRDKKKHNEKREVLVKAAKRNVINEAFRVLRTNVQFMAGSNPGNGASVTAITSFNPGSGKSFITVNLGAAISLKDKKVLLIDGDLRHGTTSSYFGSPSKGLSNYLNGQVSDVNSIILNAPGYSGLYVLPAGKVPPNPTELLETPRFEKMLDELRKEYDYIIIDCPPIEVVADAQIIDRHVDRTIFIVRAGLLERSMLNELDRLYSEKKYRNMAFVLNGTNNQEGRYGYSHSYRYGYGYGYGYGYNYSGNHDDDENE